MNLLTGWLDINSIFFTVFDYPMSYIEFIGTIFTVWCVWLTAKAKILSWPVGLIGSVLYLILFYQIQFYSDLLEQVYFLITGVTGWAMWVYYKKEINTENHTVKVGKNGMRANVIYAAIVVVGTVFLSYLTMNFNNWWPQYFPEPVSLPVLDALTTVMSFMAQWLLMRKKVESWLLWIIVDFIGVGLYWFKGVKLISLEYLLFLGIAIYGLWSWNKNYQSNKQKNVEDAQITVSEGLGDREVLSPSSGT